MRYFSYETDGTHRLTLSFPLDAINGGRVDRFQVVRRKSGKGFDADHIDAAREM